MLKPKTMNMSWHIFGSLIPLAPLILVGFYKVYLLAGDLRVAMIWMVIKTLKNDVIM